ncbi:hypothetical protein [Teredinibacter turnerae]|uniref:hypothetical protein n=1 Tax=Teredinibacter turnerae TaxID=2426 RepID=UPI000418E5ED|nr:hypothetical protein [Teredinibacter turnerae]
MKPVIFDYAVAQKDGDFTEVFYDYDLDQNTINGETIIEKSKFYAAYTTKTKVQRESDDSPSAPLLNAATKTDVKREADDCSDNLSFNTLTKTNTQRESDDHAMDVSIMLLTKTESSRESDE